MLDRTPLIYADACVYLDLITNNRTLHKDTGEERLRTARSLFIAVRDGQARLAASAMIQAEVMCNGNTRVRSERSEKVREWLHSWFVAPSLRWTDVDRFLAREAERLTKQYGHLHAGDKKLSGVDATHLAAALRLKCDYLMTHDEGFPLGHDVEGVKVMRPVVVWQESLFD